MVVWLALVTCAWAGLPSEPAGEPPTAGASPHVRAALIAEHATVPAGGTTTLGVSFEIAPDWHLYWNGYSDTGMPPDVRLSAPAGVALGEIQWPAPTRHVSPGDLLDLVYERRVTLLVPVKVSEAVKAGDAVTITGELEWLVCKDSCVPGAQAVSITLPIVAPGEGPKPDPATAARFAEARARLPGSWNEAEGKQARLEGRTLRIAAPGARGISVYPLADSRPVEDLLERGRAAGETLAVRLGGQAADPRPVRAVVEIDRGTARREFYLLELPAPRAAGTPDGERRPTNDAGPRAPAK
ncbi:MAG TPA: protein-disulfide reductase DsbD domain-containing protein [Phycisphaerales bacterium]|nr:protein-disulfide reductase DsbD domain-containing protein [Phycisphaerales bacterium]